MEQLVKFDPKRVGFSFIYVAFKVISIVWNLNFENVKLSVMLGSNTFIGEGKLGLEVFHALMKDSKFKDVPMILEISEQNTRSKSNLEVLQRL